jgi:hypothetical protein
VGLGFNHDAYGHRGGAREAMVCQRLLPQLEVSGPTLWRYRDTAGVGRGLSEFLDDITHTGAGAMGSAARWIGQFLLLVKALQATTIPSRTLR